MSSLLHGPVGIYYVSVMWNKGFTTVFAGVMTWYCQLFISGKYIEVLFRFSSESDECNYDFSGNLLLE